MKGKRSTRSIVSAIGVFALLASLSFAPMFAIGEAAGSSMNAVWPMYHGPANGNGTSSFSTARNQGAQLWVKTYRPFGFALADEAMANVPVIGPDGMIYCSCRIVNHSLYTSPDRHLGLELLAIANNGTLMWSKAGVGSWRDAPTYAVSSGGTLFAAGIDEAGKNVTYAFDNHGVEIWACNLSGEPTSPFVLDHDDNIYFVLQGTNDTSRASILQQVMTNGIFGWNITLRAEEKPSENYFEPPDSLVMTSNGTLYAQVGNNLGMSDLYSISKNGTLNWHKDTFWTESELLGMGPYTSPCLGSDGSLLAVFGHYFQSGYELVRILPNGSASSTGFLGGLLTSPAEGVNGTIYIETFEWNASRNSWYGELRSLTADLKQNWAYNITLEMNRGGDGTFVYSAPVVSAEGTVYACTYDHLLALNPNGTLRFRVNYTTGVENPLRVQIGLDGAVYVGIDQYDGLRLYAYGPTTVSENGGVDLGLMALLGIVVLVAVVGAFGFQSWSKRRKAH